MSFRVSQYSTVKNEDSIRILLPEMTFLFRNQFR